MFKIYVLPMRIVTPKLVRVRCLGSEFYCLDDISSWFLNCLLILLWLLDGSDANYLIFLRICKHPYLELGHKNPQDFSFYNNLQLHTTFKDVKIFSIFCGF